MRRPSKKGESYSIYKEIERGEDRYGDPLWVEVDINFKVASHTPASPATRTDPEWPDEFEFEIESIELAVKSSSPPLSDTEKQALRAWFESAEGQEAARDKVLS